MTCSHCWAQGKPYAPMPVANAAWALDQARRFCERNSLALGAWPMHEILTHPDVSGLLKIFVENLDESDGFEPVATDGVALATREDWQSVMEAARSMGTKTFWFAFHGMDDAHDRLVHRAGAFRESCLAVERVHTLGFRCGCNVFVTKEIAHEADRMAEFLRDLGMDEQGWEIANFYPTARARRYESVRPDLEDLAPVAAKISGYSVFGKEQWDRVDAWTEAAHMSKAMKGDTDANYLGKPNPDVLHLVCRNNLDVYCGNAGQYGVYHGNLRADGPDRVFERAVACGPCSGASLYFSTDAIPSLGDLAERWGDPKGTKIHFNPASMHWRWLDDALAEHRRN